MCRPGASPESGESTPHAVGILAWVLGLAYALGSAATARGYCAYVANSESDLISVIETSTNTVLAPIEEHCSSGRCDPESLAFSPDGRMLYVANGGYDTAPGYTLAVVETTRNTVVSSVIVGNRPAFVAITPNGALAYVTGDSSVAVVDTKIARTDPSNAVVDELPLQSAGVVISPDGRFAYIATCSGGADRCDASSARLSVLDTGTQMVLQAVPGGGLLSGLLAITPNGAFLYGADPYNNLVAVIDTAKALTDPSHAIRKTIPVGDTPFTPAVTPDGRFTYVPNCGEHCMSTDPSTKSSISVIDTATNTIATSVPLPAQNAPAGIAFTPDGRVAYVANAGVDTVDVVDTAKALTAPAEAVVASIPVGLRPVSVAIAPFPCGQPPTCVGDCDNNGAVTVSELITMVNVALGIADVSHCAAGDANQDGQIAISEIITAVNKALNGC